MKSVRMIGFWSGDPESDASWVHPSILVAPNYYGDEKERLVAYLKAGHRINFELGYSFCRFEGGPPDQEMGTCDKTDGTWVWPEGLWIYVDRYAVRLPEEFLAHAYGLNYCVPKSASALNLNSMEYDSAFWNEWSVEQQKAFRDPEEGSPRPIKEGRRKGSVNN